MADDAHGMVAATGHPPVSRPLLSFNDRPLPEFLLVNCPHCTQPILVAESDIHCGIFRHAVYRQTYALVAPHAPESECVELLRREQVWGCCGPFRLLVGVATPTTTGAAPASDNGRRTYTAIKCGYI